MARKRKKKNRKLGAGGFKPRGKLSPVELEASGKRHLEALRYKDAVAVFKDLLQLERRPEWVELLADAYAGHAQGLADKGLFKEAIAIRRNRAELCDKFLAEPAYIELLFRTGQVEIALRLIKEQRKQIEAQGHLSRLRVICAVQALAGREVVLEAFASDDSLLRDFPAAEAALQAYCQGQDAEMDQELKRIPFRSPFRDFRQILKAFSVLNSDASEAEKLLNRVDSGSPFYSLCMALRISQLPVSEFLSRYRDMNAAEKHFTTTLRGWSPQQVSLAHELYQLGEQPGADRLLRFLLRHRKDLGGAYVREVGMRILIVDPRGKAAYTKQLGRLSPFHQQRIDALRIDEEAPPYSIFNIWLKVSKTLDKRATRLDSESALTVALILRRTARQWLQTESPIPPVFAALERSLECDPDDLPTYLELIRLYRADQELKDARRLLDKALSRYPENAAVLTEAVETSIAGKAFKKASRFARKALELDPINSRVRNILLNAHLAHARKLIQQKKHPLARKELDEAANWVRTEAALGQIDLTWGMLELGSGDKDGARKRFLTGFERTGGGLVGQFHLLLEAGRMKRPMSTTLKQAKLPKLPRSMIPSQVLSLVHELDKSGEEDRDNLIKALKCLGGPLKKAAKLDYSFAEMERLCESWLRLEQNDLRAAYARIALKRWPRTPTFVFHSIDANRGRFMWLSPQKRLQLDTAYEQARAEGDMRNSHRIAELLDEDMTFGEPHDDFFDPFEFGGGTGPLPGRPDIEPLLEMIIESGGPDIEKLKKELRPEELRGFIRAMLQETIDIGAQDDILGQLPKPKARKQPRKKGKKHDQDQFDLF